MSEPFIAPPAPFIGTGIFNRLGNIEDLTPKYLRENYLLGLEFVDNSGNPYPDSFYQNKIDVAISRFEHHTQLTVTPREVIGELHDYHVRDYQQYCYIQLYQYPLIVTASYPVVSAVYPTGQVITTFPKEWVRADAQHGSLQLVPTQGSLAQVILGQGGSYLPIIYQGLGYLPQLFHINYMAGFEHGKIPTLFIDAIGKLATIEILSILGETVWPAGLTSQSLSVDGLSESRGIASSPEFSPAFSGHINQYKRELFGDPRMSTPGLFDHIRQFYRGINSWVTV